MHTVLRAERCQTGWAPATEVILSAFLFPPIPEPPEQFRKMFCAFSGSGDFSMGGHAPRHCCSTEGGVLQGCSDGFLNEDSASEQKPRLSAAVFAACQICCICLGAVVPPQIASGQWSSGGGGGGITPTRWCRAALR